MGRVYSFRQFLAPLDCSTHVDIRLQEQVLVFWRNLLLPLITKCRRNSLYRLSGCPRVPPIRVPGLLPTHRAARPTPASCVPAGVVLTVALPPVQVCRAWALCCCSAVMVMHAKNVKACGSEPCHLWLFSVNGAVKEKIKEDKGEDEEGDEDGDD
eukprot:1161619-Pelagomonas_calceolata.AAC.6